MNGAPSLNIVAGAPREVQLRDGTRVRPRTIRSDDKSRLVRRLALVVAAPADPGALIAVARYEATTEAGCAEVTFVVQDSWQSRGLGTILFRKLLEAAGRNGIRRFCAWVLADNRRMLDLISRLGEVRQRALEQGVADLTFTARDMCTSPCEIARQCAGSHAGGRPAADNAEPPPRGWPSRFFALWQRRCRRETTMTAMGLERALGMLILDTNFCERFLLNPTSAAWEAGRPLSPIEVVALSHLSRAAILRFRESLDPCLRRRERRTPPVSEHLTRGA